MLKGKPSAQVHVFTEGGKWIDPATHEAITEGVSEGAILEMSKTYVLFLDSINDKRNPIFTNEEKNSSMPQEKIMPSFGRASQFTVQDGSIIDIGVSENEFVNYIKSKIY